MVSNTSGKQLSDRLIDTLNDSLAEFVATDYVQKLLMTGEMSEHNIMYAKRHWKRSKDVATGLYELNKKASSISIGEHDQKTMAELVRILPTQVTLYYDGFERQLGGIGADIKSLAMDDTMIDYNILLYREMKHGSFVRLLVTQLVSAWFVCETHEYLKRQPQYRANPLADYLLYVGFDMKSLVNLFKGLIDGNASNISADDEKQLIQLVTDMHSIERKFYLNI